MKEYFFHITQQTAGKVVTIPDVPEQMAAKNVLAVINTTSKETLISPMHQQNLSSVEYSSNTLTVTLSSVAPSIAAGDKLLVKCYTDTDAVAAAQTAIINAMPSTTALAKEATLGTTSDSTVATTIFGWLGAIWNKLVGIVTTYPYAKQSTLESVATDAASAASDAAAAKTAAQAITGYATESNATTNKNAILAKFPELLNAIKDYLGIANTDDGEGGSFDALTATEVKTAAAEVWASVWGEVLHTASEDLPLDPYGNIIEEEESESSSESV